MSGVAPAARSVRRATGLRRGLTLVELLVALAIGLLIVGGAATALLAQLDAQRQRLADARLTLTLHTVADLAVRELRRAGHWGRADDGWPDESVDSPSDTEADAGADASSPVHPAASPASNPHADLLPAPPTAAPGTTSTTIPAWGYGRASTDHPDLRDDRSQDTDEVGALRLNASTQSIDLRLAGPRLVPGPGDHWQPLTDPGRLRVTRWLVTRRDHVVDLLPTCTRTICPAGDTTCPPRRVLRLLQIDLTGHDPAAPARSRQVSRLVRMRNDEVRGRCPA